MKPEDFGIPKEQMNEINMPLWEKAITELRQMETFRTPRMKLRCLLRCFMIVTNSFSLFSNDKEDQAATADDMLIIFPYIVVKANIGCLLRHIKFIKMFEYQDLLNGETSYALNKLEISVEIIKGFKNLKAK